MKRDLEKARAWQRRSKRLRPVSEKRAAMQDERRQLVGELTGGPCTVRWDDRCLGKATQVHEPHTRARGGSILDRDNCVPLCAACHRAIHDHPAEATERGLLRTGDGR